MQTPGLYSTGWRRQLLMGTGVAIAAILILSGIGLTIGSRNRAEYDSITLLGFEDTTAYELTSEERDRFQSILRSAPSKKTIILRPPDLVLLADSEEEDEPDEFSVYLDESLIYEGFFLDAFSDRMHDRRSRCLVLDDTMKEFLLRIRKKQKAETRLE